MGTFRRRRGWRGWGIEGVMEGRWVEGTLWASGKEKVVGWCKDDGSWSERGRERKSWVESSWESLG